MSLTPGSGLSMRLRFERNSSDRCSASSGSDGRPDGEPSAFVRTLFYLFAALSALLFFPTPPAKILLRSPLLDLCELNFCANFSMEFSHPLKSAFIPHAVAVVGASDREGSRGTYVWNGVMNGRRALEAYPVNPKYKYIGVTPCWASLSELPAKIDLAVITTPASTVMGLLKECKKLGIGNVLLCPGDDAFTPQTQDCV